MLSRATSSLLRPRGPASTSRLLLAQCQTRGYQKSGSRQPRDTFRNVPKGQSELKSQHQTSRPIPSQYQDSHSFKSASARSQSNPPPQDSSAQRDPHSASSQDTDSTKQDSQPLPDLRQGIPSEYEPETEAQQPLPDLTQGIPSTIDAELSRAQRKEYASKQSLNITEDPADPLPRGVGDKDSDGLPRSSYVSSSDQKRSVIFRYFYLSMLVGGLSYAVYMGRDWTEEEQADHPEIPNGYTPSLIYQRASARFGTTVSYYKDPVTKKVLPDLPEGDPNVPPFTLVVGLEDVLIRSEWSREHGWRLAKRPGLDYFIKYLSMYYELIVFSNQPLYTVDQIHRKIDPYQLSIPLFREVTLYEDGGYVKDLSYLNRDLKKVVMLDADPHYAKNQPENAIIIPKWDGNPNDTTLIDFIPFFEYLAMMGFEDAREVLKSFEGKYIPVEFDKRQKLVREKFEAERAQKKSRRSASGIGSLFGKKSQSGDGSGGSTTGDTQSKMIWDQIRERGQESYKRMEDMLAIEGPKIIQEREANEKKAQEEAMADMGSGVMKWFGRADSGEKK